MFVVCRRVQKAATHLEQVVNGERFVQERVPGGLAGICFPGSNQAPSAHDATSCHSTSGTLFLIRQCYAALSELSPSQFQCDSGLGALGNQRL